jgi:hypothetical protein
MRILPRVQRRKNQPPVVYNAHCSAAVWWK